MPDPKLVAIVTALLLVSGASSVRAEYNLEQLHRIEGYILQKDCAALWQYLVANPSIMAGNDALSRELRLFVEATQRGSLDCFSARSAATVPPPAAPRASFAADGPVIY